MPCVYPLLALQAETLHTVNGRLTRYVSFASHKGLTFFCRGLVFGRDGIAVLVRDAFESNTCCGMVGNLIAARLMAIFNVLQFLVFGTLQFAATGVLLCVCVLAGALLTLFTCISAVRVAWMACWFMAFCCLGSVLVYPLQYVLLPFEILLPELLFRKLHYERLGGHFDTSLVL